MFALIDMIHRRIGMTEREEAARSGDSARPLDRPVPASTVRGIRPQAMAACLASVYMTTRSVAVVLLAGAVMAVWLVCVTWSSNQRKP